MAAVFVLLTDFGSGDCYAGQVKGALARKAPDAKVIDLTHEVRPFKPLHAGFFLATSEAHFPRGSVFICVVDPGVGGRRDLVMLKKNGRFFLAPDNGLLSLLRRKSGNEWAWRLRANQEGLAGGRTFHARDIMAPMAARLAHGEDPAELGDEIDPRTLYDHPVCQPRREGQILEAAVLHVDRFGNCILNLGEDDWLPELGRSGLTLVEPERRELDYALCYEELKPGLLGLVHGSQGYLELALNQDSAAKLLGLDIESRVKIGLPA